jgi:signal transduction histidine kinase
MSDYEIRLHRTGGALSIVMKVMAVGDDDAKRQALTMLHGGISNAHIWRDDSLVVSVDAPDLVRTIHRAARTRSPPFRIRPQRRARHARQIAMDAMAASLAHEIRQPLTAVITNARAGLQQLTEPYPDLKEVRATLSDIGADGRRIAEIIGGVQEMFKSSTHDRQTLDVDKVVRDVLAIFEIDARVQRVIVQTDLNDDLPPVLGDSGQLRQLFLNLITNALEAMTDVSGRPSVLRVTSGIASSNIVVTVEDTGVGIADKDASRILEPFFSTKAAGTGVGLTICNVILKAHGGSLQVSANKPYGTIARVTLPAGGDE